MARLGTTKGMHCVRYEMTRAGRRCARYSPHHKTGPRRRRGLGTTAGMHCVRFKPTRAGKRCAKYAR